MLNYVQLQLQLLIDPSLLTWHLKGTSYIKIVGGITSGITLMWASNLDEYSFINFIKFHTFWIHMETWGLGLTFIS